MSAAEVLLAGIGFLQLVQLATAARVLRRLDEFLERQIHVEAWAQQRGYNPIRR